MIQRDHISEWSDECRLIFFGGFNGRERVVGIADSESICTLTFNVSVLMLSLSAIPMTLVSGTTTVNNVHSCSIRYKYNCEY